MTDLKELGIDSQVTIESDGTPGGTKVLVDGKLLSMVKGVRLSITENEVMASITVLAPNLKLTGRVMSLEKSDPT